MYECYRSYKLMSAVRHGNFREVGNLVSTHGLSHTESNGYVLLCVAIKKGYNNIAKLLLRKGAKITRETINSSSTPLHFVAVNGNIEVTKKLLDKGADVDAQDEHYYTPLHYALKNRKIKIVKLLLNYSTDIHLCTEDGETPLYIAAEQGSAEIVKLLLSMNASVHTKTKSGLTALHISSIKGHEMVVKLLLQNGANVDVYDEYYYTPLHYALKKRKIKVVRLLLNYNTNINFCTEDGETPLYIAAEQGSAEIVKLLLSMNASVHTKTKSGLTPLYISIIEGHEMVVKLLLQSGAIINSDNTALSIAIEKGHSVIVEDILKYSPDLSSNSNRSIPNTVLSSWQGPYRKIVELLLQYRVIVIPQEANEAEVLLTLVKNRCLKIVAGLLNYGVDVNVRGRYDNLTPLHIAVEKGDIEMIKLLLDKGANVNAVLYTRKIFPGWLPLYNTTFRTTSLHIAVQEKYPEIVKILLKFGADTDYRDQYGKTALHIASEMGSQEMILTLLKHGTDINIVDNNNTTPLDCAIEYYDTWRADMTELYGNDYVRHSGPIAATIIQQHIIRMKIANLYVSEQNLALVTQEMINGYQNICESEMKLMKCTKLGNSNVYFCDILTNNISRLATYTKNENVVEAIRSNCYKTMFPVYASMISSYFKKGMKRRELQEQGEQFFYSDFINIPFTLPYNCVDNILNYLNNNDLRVLINVYKSVNNIDT